MNFVKISWDKYEQDCIAFAKKVRAKELEFDRMVVISRGGLVAGRILSDLLDLPISHITICSYLDLKQQKNIKITEVPQTTYDNEKILLVDEVSDSGRTFVRALKYFKEFKNCKVTTFSLYIKPITHPLPDYYQELIDGWIIFPYEIKETKDAFIKLFKNEQTAKEKLREVGFKEWEINQV